MSNNQMEKDRFTAAYLMEFPDRKLKNVQEAWKAKGERSSVSKQEFQRAKKWANEFLDAGQHEVERQCYHSSKDALRAQRRRQEREKRQQEGKELLERHPVGSVVSHAAMKKLYDEHAVDVLAACVTATDNRNYRITKALPAPSVYEQLKLAHFTKSVAAFVGGVRSTLEGIVAELENKFEDMSERSQEGEKGDELQEAISLLGDSAYSIGEQNIPEVLRPCPVFWMPTDKVAKRDRLLAAVAKIRFLTEHIGDRTLPAFELTRRVLPVVTPSATCKSATKKLDLALPNVVVFVETLTEVCNNMDAAADYCPKALL